MKVRAFPHGDVRQVLWLCLDCFNVAPFDIAIDYMTYSKVSSEHGKIEESDSC